MSINQQGFGHIIAVTCILAVLIAVGAFTFFRVNQSGKSIGAFEATNFGVYFKGQSDKNYVYQYSLDAYFDDSFDTESSCPSRLDSFNGGLSIMYTSDTEATVNVTQNIKPHHEKDNGVSGGVCPAVVVQPFTKNIQFSKDWIEKGSTSKTVQVNGQKYTLTLDKQARTISFGGEDYDTQTQPYLPDGIAQLYAYPMYKGCMTQSQIQVYANEHKIVSADTKYPGLTAGMKAIPNLVLEAPDGSTDVLLVIADDYVKQLVETTRNERGVHDDCHVVASAPVYDYISR